jgi:hypothetical protein
MQNAAGVLLTGAAPDPLGSIHVCCQPGWVPAPLPSSSADLTACPPSGERKPSASASRASLATHRLQSQASDQPAECATHRMCRPRVRAAGAQHRAARLQE